MPLSFPLNFPAVKHMNFNTVQPIYPNTDPETQFSYFLNQNKNTSFSRITNKQSDNKNLASDKDILIKIGNQSMSN